MESDQNPMQPLESRFDLNDQRVWFGKAKLLADRIVLTGLGYHRRIMLEDILEVRWAADELVIVLADGDEVDMTIRSAALWKYELQARCGLKDAGMATGLPDALKSAPVRPRPEDIDLQPQLTPGTPTGDGVQGPDSAETLGHATAAGDGSQGSEPADSDEADTAPGEQTEMFLQRESTYRIRSSFADDRPGRDGRSNNCSRSQSHCRNRQFVRSDHSVSFALSLQEVLE